MKKNNFIIFLNLVLALLLFSGAALATPAKDFDKGESEGVKYYGVNGSFDDYDDAYIEYSRTDDYDNAIKDVDNRSDFKRGFKEGYKKASKGDVKEEYGKSLGDSLGKTYGLEDFQKARDSDWKKAIPSDRDISRMYNLKDLPNDYERIFLNEFRNAFKDSYNKAYEEALLDPPKVSLEQGLSDGEAAGKSMGMISADKDYLYKNSMNDKRDLLSNSQIREKYRLNLGNNTYEDAFIQAFKREYMRAYNEKFRELSQKDSLLKSVSTRIMPAGGEFGIDNDIKITVKPGSFYMPLMVTINTRNTDYYSLGTYTRASEIYGIELHNPAGSLEDKNTITVSFPYYGDRNKVGLYKMVGGSWSYLPSKVKDNVISAELLPSTLSNRESVFAVFVDNNVRVLTDVRGHWANEEIETMVRRNIITGYPGRTYLDGTFKPDQPVTRAEFLILLSRAESWTLPNYIANSTYFKDYSQFQNYGNIISYGLSKGHVLGYTDRTFRPYNPISYYEVELIMGRVLNNNNFKWNTFAEQMMFEKGYKSQSFQNVNRKITRAEVSYMLYTLNQWRY